MKTSHAETLNSPNEEPCRAPREAPSPTPRARRLRDAPRPVFVIATVLDAEIESRERELASRRSAIQVLEAELTQLRTARAAIDSGNSAGEGNARVQTNGDFPDKTTDAQIIRAFARRALIGAGRPLTRTELLRMMDAEGITLTAKDPARRIGRVLWKSREFVSVPEGYWISDRDIASATRGPRQGPSTTKSHD